MISSTGSILAVTSQLPWPLDRGGHLRSFHMLQALARRFALRVVAGVTESQLADVDTLGSLGIMVRPVLLRHRQLPREALRAGVAALARQPYVFYRRHNRRDIRRAVEAELARHAPDILYCDHLDSWLFARPSNGRTTVVDLHNVYSSLVRRMAEEQHSRLKRLYLRREATLLARIEQQVVRSADLVFAVSHGDRTQLVSGHGAHVHVVPNGVDCRTYDDLPTGRQDRSLQILFLGTLSWMPNITAATYLARVVLPRVAAAIPEVRLSIVGREPSAEVLALGSDARVDVLGSVPDVRPHLARAQLLAVPLEAGGGTRLKILEAFAAGLPVVSTSVGCEGLRVVHNEHLLIAERDEFDQAILALLSDPALALRLSSNARRLVREHYDWRSIAEDACGRIAAAVAG